MNRSDYYTGSHGTIYYVRNMKESVAFYTKQLGKKPTQESDSWTEFDLGATRLCLHHADAKMKALPGGVMILNVKKMKELIPLLKKDGAEFSGEPHNVYGDDYTVDYKDPDGNHLSLYGTL